jgi:hypothetical protein
VVGFLRHHPCIDCIRRCFSSPRIRLCCSHLSLLSREPTPGLGSFFRLAPSWMHPRYHSHLYIYALGHLRSLMITISIPLRKQWPPSIAVTSCMMLTTSQLLSSRKASPLFACSTNLRPRPWRSFKRRIYTVAGPKEMFCSACRLQARLCFVALHQDTCRSCFDIVQYAPCAHLVHALVDSRPVYTGNCTSSIAFYRTMNLSANSLS